MCAFSVLTLHSTHKSGRRGTNDEQNEIIHDTHRAVASHDKCTFISFGLRSMELVYFVFSQPWQHILRPRGIRRDSFSKLEQNDGSYEFQCIRTIANVSQKCSIHVCRFNSLINSIYLMHRFYRSDLFEYLHIVEAKNIADKAEKWKFFIRFYTPDMTFAQFQIIAVQASASAWCAHFFFSLAFIHSFIN